jgi:hypothetical protein
MQEGLKFCLRLRPLQQPLKTGLFGLELLQFGLVLCLGKVDTGLLGLLYATCIFILYLEPQQLGV